MPMLSPPEADVRRIQRRTLSLLLMTQTIGGIGVAVGISVGALLAADMGGAGISGLASSAAVVGGALLAVPATRLMRIGGRRPGLVFAYLVGALGAGLVITGASLDQLALVFLGTMLFGGASTANLQARYTAVDLARPSRRGRQLSLVVWATTIGAVTGPNAAPLADRAVAGWGLREYSGPYVFSALAFVVTAGLIYVLLRPDPLLVARAVASGTGGAGPATATVGVVGAGQTGGFRRGWAAVVGSVDARLGMAAVAIGHLVMVAVMSMTPVHINHGGMNHADVLRIVGVVLSLHIAGMYALAPVMGWLSDRFGRRPVIVLGVAVLVSACAVAGTAEHHTGRLSTGLVLLGLGWSATMVAGSTLLSESVDVVVRPDAQGLNDIVMGMAGALGGALSGLVVQAGGYPTLNLLAAVSALPLLVLVVWRAPARIVVEPETDTLPAAVGD